MTLHYRFVSTDGTTSAWVAVAPGTVPVSSAPPGSNVEIKDIPDLFEIGKKYIRAEVDPAFASPFTVLFLDADGNAYGTCQGNPGALRAAERSHHTEAPTT